MSFFNIITFLYPLYSAYNCYSQATQKFSNNLYLLRDRRVLEIEQNQTVIDFVKSHIPNKDIYFFEGLQRDFTASGTPYFANAEAYINLPPWDFHKLDIDACLFMLKHEVSHIKHNDIILHDVIMTIFSTAIALIGTIYLSCFYSTIFTLGTSLLLSSYISIYRESQADSFAIEHSSIDELLGSDRILRALQQVNKQCRNKFFLYKFLYSPQGESRLDIFHPSLSSRILKVQQAISLRREPSQENPEKFQALVDFFSNLYK